MTAKEAFGYMWECPDLFEMSGKWFLAGIPARRPSSAETRTVSEYFISPGISCVRTSPHWKIPITHVIQKHSASWIMALISMPPRHLRTDGDVAFSIGWAGIPRKNVENAPAIAEGWQHASTVPWN